MVSKYMVNTYMCQMATLLWFYYLSVVFLVSSLEVGSVLRTDRHFPLCSFFRVAHEKSRYFAFVVHLYNKGFDYLRR